MLLIMFECSQVCTLRFRGEADINACTISEILVLLIWYWPFFYILNFVDLKLIGIERWIDDEGNVSSS